MNYKGLQDLYTVPPLPHIKTFAEQMAEVNQPYTAKSIFLQLIDRIQRFECTLDQEHEVGVRLVHFGQSIQFNVLRIGCMDPSLIWFEGTQENGSTIQLIQHVSQISFLLIASKRLNPQEPKRKIGFCSTLPESDQVFSQSLEVSDQTAASQQE